MGINVSILRYVVVHRECRIVVVLGYFLLLKCFNAFFYLPGVANSLPARDGCLLRYVAGGNYIG